MFVLSLAGLDPSGGAGVFLDLKVFSILGLKGGGIPTTLTLQNTSVFESWIPIESAYLKRALELVFSDLPVKGVKIGMIGTPENAEIIAFFLRKYRKTISWIVLDPVIKASLNYPLFSSEKFLITFKKEVLPYVDVITPNVFEASFLTDRELKKREFLIEAAKILLSLGPKFVIIKGWESSSFIYDFFFSSKESLFLKKKKINLQFHGTGCAFSSALLSFLIQNFSPQEAFKKAKNWLYLYLQRGEREKLGGKLCLFL
ncbi:MAG: hydroxymethylpyrimidine/phosphomethylpyrimidine kinase [Thermodesulfobacteriaceae bacterium]|nr:hydroxymethylpyrimidine/phosphomethylpyrimidine kinase [Thermodesulfobacteriaceae bacterium]MCX8041839.1 hydroxymethylpyrimidine/phosphomethylpyrimidine kinase [Thermodesulfobacteriaceae bacterium]MDW8136285.1 hydroxymethylpyrimidine/phosphomethylpyrimidine kinase [Thermodesulfobacterium sp.]